MKRFSVLAAMCFLLAFLAGCKKTIEKPVIENVNESITLTSIESQPDQIILKFVHGGSLPQAKVGIVHAADSTELVSKIADGRHEVLTATNDRLYTYTFDRTSAEGSIYYSFCLSVDGEQYYSPIHRSSFGVFKFWEVGFTEQDVLASIYTPEMNFDFLYLFKSPFEDFENLKILLDNMELDYHISGSVHPEMRVKIPESVKSGNHLLRIVYRGNDVVYKRFFIPKGKVTLATQHPAELPEGLYYVYDSKIYTVTSRDDLNNLEYWSWNPAANSWDVKTIYTEGYYSYIFNSTSSYNTGVQFGDKIFFRPGAEFVEGGDTTYYMQTIAELDPVKYTWKKHVIRKTPVVNNTHYYQLQVEDMLIHQGKLYMLQRGYNGQSPEEGFQINTYSPGENLYKKMRFLPLPPETAVAHLLKDGDNFYIVAYLEFHNPWVQWDYETRIYQTDATFQTLKLLTAIPTEVFEGFAFLLDKKVYVFGGYQEGTLRYSERAFGLEYDIQNGKSELLNPTYSLFGVSNTAKYGGFLFALNGKIYNGYGSLGEIVEWDIHYRE